MSLHASPCMEKPAHDSQRAAGPATGTSSGDATLSVQRIVYGPDASPDGFEALAAEWNDLVRRSRTNTFFLTHEWQTTWWHLLGSGELWILAFRCHQTGQLVGIAPLYRQYHTSGELAGQHQLYIIGCIEVSDYLDLIMDREWEAAVYHSLLAWLTSPDAPAWDSLDLCNLPEGSLTYQLLPQLYADAGLGLSVFQEDVAPSIHLPPRYADYLQNQVEKRQRHEIRRKQRRAEREAKVGFYVVGPQHDLAAEVDDFIALQRMSGEDKAQFMTPEMERFFHAVARHMLASNRLQLCFLTLDGDKAAALFAFHYGHRFLLYNSGYNPDSHAQLSPGWVLLAYAIQYAIVLGCKLFDFMQGDEEYKYRFGSQNHSVMRVIVRRSG